MEIRLLGPVGLWRAGQEVALTRTHRRCVLAVLAMTPGQAVPIETLIDRVWGDRPPHAVRNSLYTHVSAVRRLLDEAADIPGGPALQKVSGGYVLNIDPGLVDLHRVRQYAGQARALTGQDVDHGKALELLREACSLWRGAPLAGLTSDWATRARAGLEYEHVAVIVDRYRLELRLGEHASAVGPLAELLADHPLVEPLVGLQMLALYQCNRQLEAVDLYAKTRRRLVDQFGDEPGAELRQLHEQILRRDTTLAVGGAHKASTAEAAPSSRTAAAPPAQLPPSVASLVDRAPELKHLDALLPNQGDLPPAGVVISTIDGAAGVGKTALALYWAHSVAKRFPDGQLYVDLRGFDPRGRPVEPARAIRGFLDALGVPPRRVPASLPAQVGLYRSVLAKRRMLVLLDNARNSAQVRPLLPGSPGSMVVVTSRHQLSSLVAIEGARPLTLDGPRAERITTPQWFHRV